MNKYLKTTLLLPYFIIQFSSAQCNVVVEKLDEDITQYSMSEIIFKEDFSEPWFFAIAFSVNAYYDSSRSASNFVYELVPTLMTDTQVMPTPNDMVFHFNNNEPIVIRASKKSYNTINGKRVLPDGLTSIEGTFTPSPNEFVTLGEKPFKAVTLGDYNTVNGITPPITDNKIIMEMIQCVTKRMGMDMKRDGNLPQ